ncbi:MAG: hypothetical protein J5950_01595, partial [Clostridia bacterium]|nr:hypothetical protein [Clostridia bacterium]
MAICLFDETGLLVSAEINDAVSGVINYVITSETDEQNNKICTVSVQDADDHKKYVFDSSGREIYSEEFDKEYGCMKYTETVITEYECEDKNVKYMYVTRTLLPDVKTAYED